MKKGKLVQFLKETNIPKIHIARLSGIKPSCVSRFISGERKFSEKRLDIIARAILELEEQESSRIEQLMRKTDTQN